MGPLTDAASESSPAGSIQSGPSRRARRGGVRSQWVVLRGLLGWSSSRAGAMDVRWGEGTSSTSIHPWWQATWSAVSPVCARSMNQLISGRDGDGVHRETKWAFVFFGSHVLSVSSREKHRIHFIDVRLPFGCLDRLPQQLTSPLVSTSAPASRSSRNLSI